MGSYYEPMGGLSNGPFLDVGLPRLTRSTSATSSVHGTLQYDFRQRVMATDVAEP